MSTPNHCPGFKNFKHLESFMCNCPECGAEVEIFSDEFDKQHKCRKCGVPIDFNSCSLHGKGGSDEPA